MTTTEYAAHAAVRNAVGRSRAMYAVKSIAYTSHSLMNTRAQATGCSCSQQHEAGPSGKQPENICSKRDSIDFIASNDHQNISSSQNWI